MNQTKRPYRFNQVKPVTQVIFRIVVMLFSLFCVLPYLFVIIISISSRQSILANGYSFFPSELSFEAYKFVFQSADQLYTSFGVSIVVTVAGTIGSLLLTALYAYVLFRKDYSYRKFFTYFAFFPMLFGGGMVPYYVVVTRVLGLKDTLWALILPGLLSTFNIIILRTFFTISIPMALLEAAEVDGCGELRKFVQIILPVSLPGLATVGLFSTLGYWNEWFQGLLFITDQKLLPLQNVLMLLEKQMDYIFSQAKQMNAAQYADMIKNMPTDSVRMVFVVLIVLPIACAYPFFQKYFVQGLTVGSVKG